MRRSARLSPRIGALLLIIASALWGSSVVVIKQMLPDISAPWINFGRFCIAAVALSVFIRADRRIWKTGIEMGTLLFAGFATQTVSLQYTTANRCSFITALNVLFVPMIAAGFGRRISPIIWAAAVTSLIGCGLLCGDGSGPNLGDVWALLTAILWAAYIYRLESKAAEFPPLPLAIAQLIPIALISGVWVAARPQPVIHFHWPSLLFLGLGASAATTCLQAFGQRVVPAPHAAVIFTLEPVFTAIFAFLILHERLTPAGSLGAALIIIAAIATQFPSPPREPSVVVP